MRSSFATLSILIGFVWPTVSHAVDISGLARIIDGDTVEVQGQKIRLHGIDAPESKQQCQRSKDEFWPCGKQATLSLVEKINGSQILCEGRDQDRYGRVIAVCFSGETDLNAWMVSHGWAVSYRKYSKDYVSHEEVAQSTRLGVWAGKFVMPWEWRQGQRLKTANVPDNGDCKIKGNISRNGARIYHAPGGRWYSRTKIDQTKGERYFCSNAEAVEAGWRRSSQ
jgi:endonuclease YncB( thermonuclease family)